MSILSHLLPSIHSECKRQSVPSYMCMCGAVTVGRGRRILIGSEHKKARTEATTTLRGMGTIYAKKQICPRPSLFLLLSYQSGWMDHGWIAVFFLEGPVRSIPFRSITLGNVFRPDTIKTKPRSHRYRACTQYGGYSGQCVMITHPAPNYRFSKA